MTWQSLHLCYSESPETIIQVIEDAFIEQGYTRYNPFDVVPGVAYPNAIRLFLDPTYDRIVGNPTPPLAAALSRLGVVLSLTLIEETAEFVVYAAGQKAEPLPTLEPYLRDGFTATDLQNALSGSFTSDMKNDNIVPMDVLPDDVKQMATKLNPNQVNRLFNRIMKQLGIKGDEARNALTTQQTHWMSAGGKRLHAIMRCLAVSSTWYKPDFVSIRDAYLLQLRRQRNPKAHLYPGDAETLQAVPNALDYIPIYGGKV